MRPIRYASLALGLALPLLSACGPSCEDACAKRYDCLSRMSVGWTYDEATCLASCEQGFCHDPARDGRATDCYAAMLCENGTGATGEMLNCASKCQD